ncbi:choloylglycine hydrolase family protein [Enterococcus sp. LJL99]
MCTSIFTETKDGKHLLARTMDFSYPLNSCPVFIPRAYQWQSVSDQKSYQNKYGFTGAGKNLEGSYFVAGGVNEKGLSVAELYLPGEAVYQKEVDPACQNFAPHEFILHLLGNFSTIEEIGQELNTINLVAAPAPELGIITPLHWIITDESGKSVVIEPTEKTLSFKENPVNVMTNTPQLEWHIQNLRNYLSVRPMQYDSAKFGDFEATPFSQGTGTSGLPGGYTPPERFVRAAFLKEYIKEAANEDEGVMNVFHILASVRIPKGIVLEKTGNSDYSQYVSISCNESKTFYYTDYASNEIAKVTLTDELLAETEVKEFPISRNPIYKVCN